MPWGHLLWRTAGGAAPGPRLHGSTDPVKAGRCMCQSSFYYKSTLKKESRRGEEESRNASFEVGLKVESGFVERRGKKKW